MRRILLTEEQLKWYKGWIKKFRDGIRYVPTGCSFEDWFFKGHLLSLQEGKDAIDIRSVGIGKNINDSDKAFAKWLRCIK